ncbi:recombinase RecT [Streptomyces albireticuli]|uniref:recombinase RecT n=1 Tax=Streptomyces albireticuli TaxID=1940 RepID=UPI001473A526|nr:recombinase RecT [Streptomyces albireticuli]MCD9194249.1 recombinase RecT [Streptomyces albireticuli]
MTSTARNAVAVRAQQAGQVQPATEPALTLAHQIDRMRPEIARALPAHMDADRIARIALTTLRRTPKLGECSPESFLGALMTCSQLGVEPGGPTGEAYLVPFKGEVTFVLGYRGMAKLFWQSPMAKSLSAQVVYDGDFFEYEYGLDQRLVHRPALTGRGKAIAYYAVATTTTGGSAFVVLSPEDIEKHRKHSSFPNGGPWRDHYEAMARKTCVRELFKLLPTSVELAQATAHDGTVRTDASLNSIDAPGPYSAGELEVGSATTSDADPQLPVGSAPRESGADHHPQGDHTS